MTDFMKVLLKNGLGTFGDHMYNKTCPFVVYEPKKCRRPDVQTEITKKENTLCKK